MGMSRFKASPNSHDIRSKIINILRKWANVLLAAAVSVICLIILELGLPQFGYSKWQIYNPSPNEPTFAQPDDTFGWHPKPGTYNYPGYSKGAADIKLTQFSDGRRATGETPDVPERQIILIGGSYAQGGALSDHQQFAAKLQSVMPKTEWMNYAVSGHGSFQALLILERLLSTKKLRRPLVIYGFGDFHADRNIAQYRWISMLNRFRKLTDSPSVYLPYADIDEDGNLVRRSPKTHTPWWLSRYSNLASALERALTRMIELPRVYRKREATVEIVKAMRSAALSAGAEFLVVALHYDKPRHKIFYEANFTAVDIPYLDCSESLGDKSRYIIRGHNHPNEKRNDLWASCLARRIGVQWPVQ